MKTYNAIIKISTGGNNTTTVRDTCSATSRSEAERTFAARYPNALSISGVQEVR